MASHQRLKNNGPTRHAVSFIDTHRSPRKFLWCGGRGFLQFRMLILMNGFIFVLIISDGSRGGSPDRAGQENHDDFIRRRRNWRRQVDWRNFGYHGQGAKPRQVSHRYRHGTSMRFDTYSLKQNKTNGLKIMSFIQPSIISLFELCKAPWFSDMTVSRGTVSSSSSSKLNQPYCLLSKIFRVSQISFFYSRISLTKFRAFDVYFSFLILIVLLEILVCTVNNSFFG